MNTDASGSSQHAANLKGQGNKQVAGTYGMVVTAFPSASDAAVEILRQGATPLMRRLRPRGL
jgi:gamma-glutamyltranspeptidase